MPPPAVQPFLVVRHRVRRGDDPSAAAGQSAAAEDILHAHEGGAAGRIEQRRPGHIADTPAHGRVSAGFHTRGDARVIPFKECPVVGEIAEIALDADQPARIELPVGANGAARGPAGLGNIDLSDLVERSGWRAGLGLPDRNAPVAADIESRSSQYETAAGAVWRGDLTGKSAALAAWPARISATPAMSFVFMTVGLQWNGEFHFSIP